MVEGSYPAAGTGKTLVCRKYKVMENANLKLQNISGTPAATRQQKLAADVL
jgi:hypothetical protein